MESCCNCERRFQEKKGGYYRYSLDKIVESSGLPAKEHLSELTESTLTPAKRSGRFLCPHCWNRLNETVKYKKSLKEFFQSTGSTSYVASKRTSEEPEPNFIKRPRFTSTPLKKSCTSRPTSGKSSKWDTIITAIRARQYGRAISGLYNASNGTKRHFAEVVARLVRKEVNTLINTDGFPLCQDVNIANLSDFSWETTISQASTCAPLLLSCLKGAVTTSKNIKTLIKGSKTQINLKPKIGTALGVLLYSKSPRKSAFLSTLLSVQLWRGRLKRETLKQISRLGLCVGYEATLSAIDRIREDFDAVALKCKEEIEQAMRNRPNELAQDRDVELCAELSASVPNVEDEIAEYPELKETILYSEGNCSVQELPSSSFIHNAEEEEEEGEDEEEDDVNYDNSVVDDDDDEEDSELVELEDLEGGVEQDVAAQGGGTEMQDHTFEENLMLEEEVGGGEEDNDEEVRKAEPPGFTTCWDNVGKKVISRHPTEAVKNRYLNMALGYIAINRVESLNLDWREDNLKLAAEIPLQTYIPQQSDFDHLRSRMEVLVGRIISKHIPWFQNYFSNYCTPHILHQYSMESTRKSILVNLGVFNEDPCSTQGAIGIYERLHAYVPVVDNVPVKTIVFGDGLSCERGNDAQRARSNGLTPTERLEGLEPAAQEFHKEMLLLQDFFDVFYKGASASNRGTLCQIKNLFNFRQVKSDIGDNFSHAWELMCTVVESFICLLLMHMLGINDKSSRPDNAPKDIEFDESDERKSAYFKNICTSVVDKIWKQTDTTLLSADEEDTPPVLCCGEDLDDDMIGCERRSSCLNGEFFHYSCVKVDPESNHFPWYCSDECRLLEVEPYQYCVCGQDLGSDIKMIGCSHESLCTRKEWYHMTCIGLNPDKPPKGNWYCCDECRNQSKKKKKKKISQTKEEDSKADLIKDYSQSLIWAGLNLLCRRDAVREADGEAMVSFWRIDLVHFFGNKHPKYTILTHRLLSAISGWMPDRVKFDLMHNRTVNYGGGMGRNLPLDFMNEILNRLFKDLLESAKGRYTDTTIQRCGQIIGPLGEALDTVFDTNVVENEIYRHQRRAQNRDSNVSRLIDLLQNEELFEFRAGRKHSAFSNFNYSVNPKQSNRFAAKINQLSKRLDKRRRIIIDN